MFGLRLDGRVAKFGGGLIAFGLIAGMTGQRQVGHPIGAAPRLWNDVFLFERHVGDATVGAVVPPFEQEILPDLEAKQRPALVFEATDFGVFECLHVEVDSFVGQVRDWTPAQIANSPSHRFRPTVR